VDPVLIGIHALKQSGKSTAHAFIEEWAGALSLSVAGRGFADYAKWIWTRQFFPGCSLQEAVAYVDKYKESDASVAFPSAFGKGPVTIPFRRCMAQFATEGGRQLMGDDIWVDLLLPTGHYGPYHEESAWWQSFTVPAQKINGQIKNVADFCVITDVRFENEVQRIKDVGGFCWKINREQAREAVIREAKAQKRDVHASELGLPDHLFDVVIDNNGALSDFKRRVRTEIEEYAGD
jgi:hypothetical protein